MPIILTKITLLKSGKVLDVLGTFDCLGIEDYEVFDDEQTGPLDIEKLAIQEDTNWGDICLQCKRAIADSILQETGIEIQVGR